jgi:uncharacterized membrane protein
LTMNWRIFVTTLIVIPVLDFFWLGMIASKFYVSRMDQIANIDENGKMRVVYWAAGVVYLLLALGISFFTGNYIEDADNALQAFGFAAAFGFVAYGIYDFTNYATLKSYPLSLVAADMAWGTFVCGAAGMTAYFWVNRVPA